MRNEKFYNLGWPCLSGAQINKICFLIQSIASFLREKYGDVVVRVDYGKKENRARPADDLTLTEFLAIYNDSDRYLVDTLPKEMWDEFSLPKCLSCGGFTSRLQVRKYLIHRVHARIEICSSGVYFRHYRVITQS